MESKTFNLKNGVAIEAIENPIHVLILSTYFVAKGYGVTEDNIRLHKSSKPDEFEEGKHYLKNMNISDDFLQKNIKGVSDTYTFSEESSKGVSQTDTFSEESSKGDSQKNGKSSQPETIFWTLRGIIKLGFFIQSKAGKVFRDWAEDVIFNEMTGTNAKQLQNKDKELKLITAKLITEKQNIKAKTNEIKELRKIIINLEIQRDELINHSNQLALDF